MPALETLVEDQPDIGQVIEDNILALLDTVGVKNADDIEDDKLSFLEAVYALCIAGTQPKAPTCAVHKAVFRLLEGNSSMVLNVASYSILVEIAQQYPHILVNKDNCNDMKTQVILNNKIWSPLRSDDVEEKGKGGVSTRHTNEGQQHWKDFVKLLEAIQEIFAEEADPEASIDYKCIGLILKFQYLFKILEQDFKCRFQVYKDVERKAIMSNCYVVHLFADSGEKKLFELLFNLIASSSISLKERDEFLDLKEFSSSLQALVEMRLSIELESTKKAITSPKKSRKDAMRKISMVDLCADIFHFNKGLSKTLLQVMEDTECKWRIIFAEFLKCIPKPLAAEKISDVNNPTAQDFLDCLDDVNSARNVLNTTDGDMLQFYLASAFKVGLRRTKSEDMSAAVLKLCKSLKMAFRNLQSVRKDFCDPHPIAKQALITAETLIRLANN